MTSPSARLAARRSRTRFAALLLATSGSLWLVAAALAGPANDSDEVRVEMSPPPPPEPPPPEPPPPPPPEPPPPPPPEPPPADDGKLPDRDEVDDGHDDHEPGGHGHHPHGHGYDDTLPPGGCLSCEMVTWDEGGGGALAEELAALDFDVAPEDALVYVDGELQGEADDFDGFPTYLWLPAGDHEVVVYKPGYRTIFRRYALGPGAVLALDDRMERGDTKSPSFYFRRRR